jgi:glycosyltransferase involved in cell wall biosynthesis
MAMGIPCLTTPLASEALEIVPGRDLWVGNNAEAIEEHIVYLLDNPEEAEALGDQGRKTVREIYGWGRAVNALDGLITPRH